MSVNIAALCLEWTTARKQLSQAIDAFETACSALAALGIRTGAILESAQPDFLLSVEIDLPLLAREAERVFGFIQPMKKLRNESLVLVPINRLPSELLVSIFTIAVHASRPRGPPRRHSTDFVNTISSVSSHWNYVCLGTPALWADIHFVQQGGLKHAALWLERSQSCPLTLFAMDNFYSSETRYPGYEQDLDELARHHGSRFKSLIFTMHKENPVGQTIFHAACTQHTEASVRLESLAVYGYYYPSEDSVGNMGWPSKDLMDRYLMSVRFLDVKGRLFDDWTSTVFHNLTTLRLESIADQVRPTCEEFLDVLRASPRLCSLQLDGPLINAIPSSNANPVTLNTLDLVWLKGSEPEFVRWLLNAIVSHAGGLTLVLERVWNQDRRVTLGLNPPPSMLDGVKILYLLGDCHHRCDLDLSELVRALPRLETLALESVEIQSSDLFVHCNNSHDSMLATLDLASCMIENTSGFRSMLSQLPITRLRIFECFYDCTTDELFEDLTELVVSDEPGEFLEFYSLLN